MWRQHITLRKTAGALSTLETKAKWKSHVFKFRRVSKSFEIRPEKLNFIDRKTK